MENLGNTCFLNSALQCLSHVPVLSNKLLSEPYVGDCAVTDAYCKLVHQLWKTKPKFCADVRPFYAAFCKRFPRFGNGWPHDVQEVILELLDVFEKSIGAEFIRGNFNGTESQIITYPKGVSTTTASFTTLVLEPETAGQTLAALVRRREKGDAFSGYVDDAGTVYNVAMKEMRVDHLPRILIISFTQYTGRRAVEVPRMYGDHVLFGLVVHQGSIHGGHYTAYVRHRNVWRHIDDTCITESEPPLHGDYYMAWYKKKLH
jgi:ubiquitin C-terminal hydrolase